MWHKYKHSKSKICSHCWVCQHYSQGRTELNMADRGEPGCTFHTVLFVAPTESSCVLVGWWRWWSGRGGISFFPSLTQEGKVNADPGAGVHSCRNSKVVTFPPILSRYASGRSSWRRFRRFRGGSRQTTGAGTVANGAYGRQVMPLVVVLVTRGGPMRFSPHSILLQIFGIQIKLKLRF